MIDISTRQPIGDGATWAYSGQFGAPQMLGTKDSEVQMLQVLDAILIDGFNENTATGIELLPDGFVKIKFGTAVDYQLRQKLLISGADDPNLNGEHVITSVIGADFLIKAPDVTITTGTIKARVAPLGWESIFGSTNPKKRAYRSKNPNTTQSVLYLDASYPPGSGYSTSGPIKRTMVSICRDMVDLGVQIGSYTDTVNNYSENPNGSLFWRQKGYASKAEDVNIPTPSEWTIVGNGDYFYFMVDWVGYDSGLNRGLKDLYCFGDMPSILGEADEWCCVWTGINNPNDENNYYAPVNPVTTGVSSGKFFISKHDGTVDMPSFFFTPNGSAANYTTGYSGGLEFPNPTTNSMVVSNLYTVSSGALRSTMPRILTINHSLGANYSVYNNKFIDGVLVVSVAATTGASNSFNAGYIGFDMGD